MRTKPFPHQHETFHEHKDDPFYALFWEMGLGKTKTILDVIDHRHANKTIECALIVAPNSVYSNWLTQEAPVHLSAPRIVHRYRSSQSRREQLRRALFLDPREHPGKLRLVAMSYDSLRTDLGKEFAERLCTLYKTMMVLDESSAIKNGDARRSKIAKKIGKLCHVRWIATGTPVTQSPFNVHSQIEFLSPDYWKQHGVRTYGAFKNEFGLYELRSVGRGRKFNAVVGYRDLDRLQKLLRPVSSRLLKEDSSIKLPPKLYRTVTFEMVPEQRKAYEDLRKKFVAELEDGAIVEAPLAIVRLTRLQQITSGFVTVDGSVEGDSITVELTEAEKEAQYQLSFSEETITPIFRERKIQDVVDPVENPRLKLLDDLIEECHHKVIIWTKFTYEMDLICRHLKERCVRYDGKVPKKEREEVLTRFRDPEGPQFFVANTQAISMGVTLTVAKTMIYFSNSFSLERRLQSEDRFHRIGQDQSELIIDIAAENTVDERIVESLRTNFDVAAQVNGDRYRDWINVECGQED